VVGDRDGRVGLRPLHPGPGALVGRLHGVVSGPVPRRWLLHDPNLARRACSPPGSIGSRATSAAGADVRRPHGRCRRGVTHGEARRSESEERSASTARKPSAAAVRDH
jgi:hypothetical protein